MDNKKNNALKQELRKTMKQRAHAYTKASEAFNHQLQKYVVSNDALPSQGSIILGFYIPTPWELNIKEVMHSLYSKGYKLAIPIITPNNRMEFALYHPSIPLMLESIQGRFQIYVPKIKTICVPHLIFCSALAVNKQGYRLGHGGGYYDSYLNTHTIPTIGCIQKFQFINNQFQDTWDQKLHGVMMDSQQLFFNVSQANP